MSIKDARFKGYVKIRGRPKEQAKAEIMLRQHEHKQFFFTLLDLVAIASLGVAIYLFYKGKILNGFLALLVGIVILGYYTFRNMLRAKIRKQESRR